MALAKISGIMPARLTIRGRVADGIGRFAALDRIKTWLFCGYMTGTLRRPCWTYTIARTVNNNHNHHGDQQQPAILFIQPKRTKIAEGSATRYRQR